MNDPRRLRGRLGDYAIGTLIGLAAATAFYIGTIPALIAATVLILAAAAIFAAQMVWAVQINRIFREEVDAHRIEYQPPNAYDLNTGTNPTEHNLTADALEDRLLALGVPGYIAAAQEGEYDTDTGLALTWQPSATDTTGETR